MKKLLTLLAAGALTFGVASSALATESSEGTVDHDGDGGTEQPSPEVDNNQVDCGEATVPLAPIGSQINAGGDPAEGGFAEACADGDTLPIQGAIYAEGSAEGGAVGADGDADNPEGESQGWARVNVSASPSVECGDSWSGSPDGGDYNSRDGGGSQENCG